MLHSILQPLTQQVHQKNERKVRSNYLPKCNKYSGENFSALQISWNQVFQRTERASWHSFKIWEPMLQFTNTCVADVRLYLRIETWIISLRRWPNMVSNLFKFFDVKCGIALHHFVSKYVVQRDFIHRLPSLFSMPSLKCNFDMFLHW